MNSKIHSAFINAALADASYLNGLLTGMTGGTLVEQLKSRLTEPSAIYVGANFKIVTQWTDPVRQDFRSRYSKTMRP